jgi:hypothetical protein
LQDRPKFAQILIFGLKIYNLATLKSILHIITILGNFDQISEKRQFCLKTNFMIISYAQMAMYIFYSKLVANFIMM